MRREGEFMIPRLKFVVAEHVAARPSCGGKFSEFATYPRFAASIIPARFTDINRVLPRCPPSLETAAHPDEQIPDRESSLADSHPRSPTLDLSVSNVYGRVLLNHDKIKMLAKSLRYGHRDQSASDRLHEIIFSQPVGSEDSRREPAAVRGQEVRLGLHDFRLQATRKRHVVEGRSAFGGLQGDRKCLLALSREILARNVHSS